MPPGGATDENAATRRSCRTPRSQPRLRLLGAVSVILFATILAPSGLAAASDTPGHDAPHPLTGAPAPALLRGPAAGVAEVDGVRLAVATPELPGAAFTSSVPGEPEQGAVAHATGPYREISLRAVPYGHSSPAEGLPVAAAGSASTYRATLRSERVAAQARTAAGPAASLFGHRVAGTVFGQHIVATGGVATTADIVEWVTEAGGRVWVLRVTRASRPGAPLSGDFAAGTTVTSATLSTPTTVPSASRPALGIGAPAAGGAKLTASGDSQAVSAGAVTPTLRAPGWWNDDCDKGDNAGYYRLGAVFYGVPACGPRGGGHVVHFFDGSWGVLEWQCVELSLRWMYLAYGVLPYSGNGKDLVSNYSTTYGGDLTKVYNAPGTIVPRGGDVISLGPSSAFGHTMVATRTEVDSNGDGTVYAMEENASSTGATTLELRHYIVQPKYGYEVIGWLHSTRLPRTGQVQYTTAGTVGPGGPHFHLTGPPAYWRYGVVRGRQNNLRYTSSNGSTEGNGATWSPALARGHYRVRVWIPGGHANANARYYVRDADGVHTRVLDQSTHQGLWVTLGSFRTGSSTGIKVHLSDAGDAPGSSTVAADAMRFHRL